MGFRTFAALSLIIATVSTANAGVGATLRCQAAAKTAEARVLGCVAGCRDRAVRIAGYDTVRCESKCESNYERAAASLECSFERAEIAADMTGDALRCESNIERSMARAIRCSARCERSSSPETCMTGCDAAFASALEVSNCAGDAVNCGESYEGSTGHCVAGTTDATVVRPTVRGMVRGMVADLEVVDGLAIFEGDIIVGTPELVTIGDEGRNFGVARSAVTAEWPGKVVYYTIDAALVNPVRVTDAIRHWEMNTDMRFVVRTTQTAYVTFKTGTGCSSAVGHSGVQQFLLLAPSCTTGNVIHEIGHTVGLFHEQMRLDRDANVTVNWANVQTGKAGNFNMISATGGTDLGTFDFNSVMLYGSYIFSGNGLPTMVRKDGTTFAGQRVGLSAGDRAAVQDIYECTNAAAKTAIDAKYATMSAQLGTAVTAHDRTADGAACYREYTGGRITYTATAGAVATLTSVIDLAKASASSVCAKTTAAGSVKVQIGNLGNKVSAATTATVTFPSGRVATLSVPATAPGASLPMLGTMFTTADCAGNAACPVTVTIDPAKISGDNLRANNVFTIGQCVAQ